MHDGRFPAAGPLAAFLRSTDRPGDDTGPGAGEPLVDRQLHAVFDVPSRWRAEAARVLDLRDDDVLAAMSPGAGCPAVLESVLSCLTPADGRLELVVDVGAGTGGISEWLRRRTGASVVAIEPAAGARNAARSLFPALRVRPGAAERTGLDDHVADAVVLSGVLSLIDDAGPVLSEVERILRAGGTLAVADLFSAGSAALASGPNVFRSHEQVAALLALRGWRIEEVGCGLPEPDPRWAAAARRVDRWIHGAHGHDPAYARWCADKAHLERHLAAGDLVAGCLVARRPSS